MANDPNSIRISLDPKDPANAPLWEQAMREVLEENNMRAFGKEIENERPKNYRLGPNGPQAEYHLVGVGEVTRNVRMISTGFGMRYEPELQDGERILEDVMRGEIQIVQTQPIL